MSSKTGLVTVTGGKWTTYRAMAEDVLAECFHIGSLPARAAGVTVHLPLVGAPAEAAVKHRMNQTQGLHSYGTDAPSVTELPGADAWLTDGLSEAMVRLRPASNTPVPWKTCWHAAAVCCSLMLARRRKLHRAWLKSWGRSWAVTSSWPSSRHWLSNICPSSAELLHAFAVALSRPRGGVATVRDECAQMRSNAFSQNRSGWRLMFNQ